MARVSAAVFGKGKGENQMTRSTKKSLDRSVDAIRKPSPASRVLLTRATPKRNGGSESARMPIRAGHCSGCNVRIPLALLQRALASKRIHCEHCHRELLIDFD